MGVQLDWQIESERRSQNATEDPSAKRNRRRLRRRLMLAAFFVCAVLGGVLGVIIWRLNQVDNEIRQNLLDTVAVEVTALKVGNRANFMDAKRSADADWLEAQNSIFDDYQQLKVNGQLELTGTILETTIDEPRGRVVLQEVFNGVPYRVVWFYWLYSDDGNAKSGWRRVPADVEFWGDTDRIQENNVEVIYKALDEDLAKAIAPRLRDWWSDGCELLNCETDLEKLTVEIVPETLTSPQWDLYDEWKLNVPSPLLTGRARQDQPITVELEAALAQALAERVVNHRTGITFRPTPYSDAEWLHSQYIAWLIGQFTGNTAYTSAFFDSLMDQFGPTVPSQLITNLLPNSPIGIVQSVLDEWNLERLNSFDWRNFFQWRLNREIITLQNNDEGPYFALYDSTQNAVNAANIRWNDYVPGQTSARVNSATMTNDQNGDLLAYIDAVHDDGTQITIIFRWVENTWKRLT